MNKKQTKSTIKSLQGFLKVISKFDSAEIIYRGQSDKIWKVESGAYRRLKVGNKAPNPKELLDYNKELVKRCRHYSQEFNTSKDFELLTKLQHHGAATSLIDFTKSAIIALWFACEDSKTNDKVADGKVFCLDASHASRLLELSTEDEEKDLYEILDLELENQSGDRSSTGNSVSTKPTKNERLVSWESSNKGTKETAKYEPPIIDNRVLKQDSIFIFNKTGKLDNFDKEIIIKKWNKKQIRKELKQVTNLSGEIVFPDFYGFANNNSSNKPYGPQDTGEYLQQGNEDFRLGRYEKAIEEYDKAIKGLL